MVRSMALLITGMLMLVFAAPASYALQDDTPKVLKRVDQLFDKTHPLADRYVYTSAVPDFAHTVSTKDFGATAYWVPLPGYDNQLFLRTGDKNFLSTYYCDVGGQAMGTAENPFYGKLTSLQSQLGSDEAVKEMASQGIKVDKEKAMVLIPGEQPSTYRPMVPVWGLLALLWVAALVGLVKVWRGSQRPRRSPSPSPALGQ